MGSIFDFIKFLCNRDFSINSLGLTFNNFDMTNYKK